MYGVLIFLIFFFKFATGLYPNGISQNTLRYGKVFKSFCGLRFQIYIFGREESKVLLIDFLNGLLSDEPGFSPIVDLSYLDKESPKPNRDTKGIIYDIHCRASNGKRFIVEMQNQSQTFFFDRIIYYSSTALGGQLHSGENYDEMFMPVYCVCFMNFILENDPKDFKIDAAVCNIRTGKPISDKLRYIFIQTPLFDKKREEDCVTNFDQWMFNIINMSKMGTIAFTRENEIFQKLANVASYASLTESERIAYIKELKAYSDLRGQLDYAKAEGEAKGIMMMILSMAKEGAGIDFIAKVTKKTVDEIKKIISTQEK